MSIILDDEEISRIRATVADVFTKALAPFGHRKEWQNRTGGMFCLADSDTGLIYSVSPIGDVPSEKASKYLAFCQEKARRLASLPHHMSSWQSRYPDLDKWGGAIRADRYIFSFSGAPELGDEAIMLGTVFILAEKNLAKFVGGKSNQNLLNSLHDIGETSTNEYWDTLGSLLIETL